MGFLKPDEKLIDTFYDILPPETFVEHKMLFGYPCCFVNGNMFAGIHRFYMVLRLSEEDRKEFLDRYRSRIFRPFMARRLREYVIVRKSLLQAQEDLGKWVQKAFEYALTLPGH